MFTITDDTMKVSHIRSISKELKTIPSVQFEVTGDTSTYQLVVLAMDRFNNPAVRLILEAVYIKSKNSLSAEEFEKLINTIMDNVNDEPTLVTLLNTIREKRWVDQQNETDLHIPDELVNSICYKLEFLGCLTFSIGFRLDTPRFARNINAISKARLEMVYGKDKLERIMFNISSNEEYVIACGRTFHPEDTFINKGTLSLEFIDAISGGQYRRFKTLKEVYHSDEFFSSHPDFFSRTHCECGAELVIRTNDWGEYTLMSCINPFCFEKMAFSLADFARAMGMNGLGEGTLLELTKAVAFTNCYYNGTSHCDYKMLLNRDSVEYLGDAASKLWLEFMDKIETFNGTAKELIIAMNLPYMGEEVAKILTVPVLQNQEITASDLADICYSQGKKDLKSVLNMWLYLEDFRFVVLTLAKQLNLEVMQEYLICITNSVLLKLDDGSELKMTKAAYVDYVNNLLIEAGITHVRVTLKKSVTYDCKALIVDNDTGTSKASTARSYGVPIYTSREFIHSLGGTQ